MRRSVVEEHQLIAARRRRVRRVARTLADLEDVTAITAEHIACTATAR
jgi:predicted ATPase with chaperone activity